MPTITPHLWFDTQAAEAAAFYTSVFPDSAVTSVSTLRDTPGGDTEVALFTVWGQPFQAISAGPLYRFNPSISFTVRFDPARDGIGADRLDEVWARLLDGGSALMPLDAYPFSPRYGWVQDRYGLSWQLMLVDRGAGEAADERPPIMPSLLFCGAVAGKAEEATELYVHTFARPADDAGAERGRMVRWPDDAGVEVPGTVMFTDVRLDRLWLSAMDSANPAHDASFNEAVSLLVSCSDQAEIDHYWASLSAVPQAEQCGWCKDPYGVSWQIVPSALGRLMGSGTPEQVARVTASFLAMKKLDIATLERAYEG